MTIQTALLTGVFAVIGGGIAWVYCRLARLSVERIAEDTVKIHKLLPFMLIRLGLVVGGFVGAAQFGIWAVVGNIAGFFIVRTVVLNRVRAEALAADVSKQVGQVSK